MYECMYMSIFMCVCLNVSVYYEYAGKCVSKCLCVYPCMSVYVHVGVCINVYVSVCVHVIWKSEINFG